MYDKERIEIIIETIESYLNEIKEMKINKIEDIDTIKYRALSMDIFNIINKIIDLADEVARAENLGFPSEYKSIFEMLELKKIIDEEMLNRIKDLIILRNKISHRYEILDKRDIFKALNSILVASEFTKKIRMRIKGEK